VPLSQREEVLSAFYEVITDIRGLKFVGRNTNYEIALAELPALIQHDGGERARHDVSEAGSLRIDTDVSVLVVVRADEGEDIGPYINEWIARVREKLAGNWTLDGKIWWMEYQGIDGPVLFEGESSASVAEAMINFTLVRSEDETDPYGQG
jgi:hypothetical protein